MGWTTTYRPKGWTDRDWFQRELGAEQSFVECATVKGVFYAAVKSPRTGDTFALVILTQWHPKDHYNYGWKDMDEAMQPYYYECPARVLNALTPTDNENANAWRAKCRDVLARKARLPKVGQTVRLDKPLELSHGIVRTVTKVNVPGKRDIYQTDGGWLLRFPRLAYHDFTLVTP